MSLEHCTPSDIPQEISQYDGDVAQMNVGKSGKIGYLQLELQNDSDKQKTIITKKRTQVPLYVQKALHYDLDYPSMAHVFVLSPSGGILQGDRYRMDVELKNNAISHLTTQGATRIYKMDSNYATHMVALNLKDNSYLEFIPEQIIPYKNSRFYQKTNLEIDDSSTVVYSETIVPGRIAMGEMFDFDVCYLKTEGKINGKIKFRDTSLLTPKTQKIQALTMFDDKTILTSVYVLTKKDVTKINDLINELFSHTQNMSGGSSVMPNNSGISIRILGNSSEDQKITIYEILKIIRKEILPDYL
jgi:urease accessory protein